MNSDFVHLSKINRIAPRQFFHKVLARHFIFQVNHLRIPNDQFSVSTFVIEVWTYLVFEFCGLIVEQRGGRTQTLIQGCTVLLSFTTYTVFEVLVGAPDTTLIEAILYAFVAKAFLYQHAQNHKNNCFHFYLF